MSHFHAVLPDGSHVDALGGVSLIQPAVLSHPVYKANTPTHPALLGWRAQINNLKNLIAFSAAIPSQKTSNQGNLTESDRFTGESASDHEKRCFAIVTREKARPQYALHGDLSALAGDLPEEDASGREKRLWGVVAGLMGK